jgi:hypothetical protein
MKVLWKILIKFYENDLSNVEVYLKEVKLKVF